LFTDSSVNPQKKIAYGAYLLLDEQTLEEDIKTQDITLLRFTDTSSTKAELQIFLAAIKKLETENIEYIIYTDCQNIITLENRKEKLEKNNYYTAAGKRINNYLLYQEFFEETKRLSCTLVKVQGHKKASLKNSIDAIFSLVDKTCRNALRNEFS